MGCVTLNEDAFGCFTDSRTKKSSAVRRFTWTNGNKLSIQVISYGATITTLKVPDKCGRVEDIVLGFNNMAGYTNCANAYLGAAIGRVGNRIRDSKFCLDDVEYKLTSNFLGCNQIHGGLVGFDKVNWDCYVKGTTVLMSYNSQDGEEGFPGNLLVNLSMELTDDDQFIMCFTAVTSKPTIVNLTHHSYFNLAGHTTGEEELFKHTFCINADKYTEVDDDFFSTGKIVPVTGPFDLRIPTTLSNVIGCVPHSNKYEPGYDHNFCISKGTDQGIAFVGRVTHPPSGRALEVYSNQPGVQFYTSNTLKNQQGKEGTYGLHSAFCLEPQNYPDAIHFDNFPDCKLYPGEMYTNNIIYKFMAID